MADLQIPGIELEHAFSIEMFFAEGIDFLGPRGGKGYVPPASGSSRQGSIPLSPAGKALIRLIIGFLQRNSPRAVNRWPLRAFWLLRHRGKGAWHLSQYKRP